MITGYDGIGYTDIVACGVQDGGSRFLSVHS